jgi:hypothetical protein
MRDRQPVTSYRIVRHGRDASSYFPGHGLSFSRYEATATGIGDTEAEAFSDALEQLAMDRWETLTIERDEDIVNNDASAHEDCECDCFGDDCTTECCHPDGVGLNEDGEPEAPFTHCGGAEGCDCPCHDHCEMHWWVSIDVTTEDLDAEEEAPVDVERERKVLISPGWGAGWSTWMWGTEGMAALAVTYGPIIAALERGEKMSGAHPAVQEFVKECEERFDCQPYLGGVSDLEIARVPAGDKYQIREYDGFETLYLLSQSTWD